MKKTINLFLTTMLLLAFGSCTKENSPSVSYVEPFKGKTDLELSVPLCDFIATVDMYYAISSNISTVRINYLSSPNNPAYGLTGWVTVYENSVSGPIVGYAGSLTFDATATFQLRRGKTYVARFRSDVTTCLVDKKFSIPALIISPEPCIGCPTGEPM
jgi:hypothetical protein